MRASRHDRRLHPEASPGRTRWSCYDRMGRITKKQVMDFAKTHFGNNYVSVFKRTGENKDAHKVTKPKITRIDIKRDGQSEWRKEWEKMPSARLEPEFIDSEGAIDHRTLNSGVDLAVVKNPTQRPLQPALHRGHGHATTTASWRWRVDYLALPGHLALHADSSSSRNCSSWDSPSTFPSARTACYVTLSGLEKNLATGRRPVGALARRCPGQRGGPERTGGRYRQGAPG